ncbi:MAG: SBBP repeat-containing protein, partial [Nitrospirae bacterium]|nr:SBBP repeat-containing protein [Nitrospirota bacterium]
MRSLFRKPFIAAFIIYTAFVFSFFSLPDAFAQQPSDGIVNQAVSARSAKKEIDENYGKLPLYFIKNEGQLDEKVVFYERGGGHSTFLTKEGAYLALKKGAQSYDDEGNPADFVRLGFLNAKGSVAIMPEGLQEARFNYLIGPQADWKTNIPSYASVLYKGLYDGVDLRFYGSNRQFEYDVIVAPGVDPSVMKFFYEGVDAVSLNSSGDLELKLAGGTIIQKCPVIYQEINGKKVDIDGSFALGEFSAEKKGFSYGFNVASYDRSQPLIIDPIVLSYATYLGDAGDDIGRAIVIDTSGNAYVVGDTNSPSFPRVTGSYDTTFNLGGNDAFISKLNSGGSALVYGTFLGGANVDQAKGVDVDSSGNAYVTGGTLSTDFPTTAGAFQRSKTEASQNVFVTKLNPTGTGLVYSTFIKPTSGGLAGDSGYSIVVDGSGNAYVGGRTNSQFFPTAGDPVQGFKKGGGDGITDAFVLELNPAGSALVFSTMLGGLQPDYFNGLDIDTSGNVYITGGTGSTDFPTLNASQKTLANAAGTLDIFLAKLNPTGSALVFSTYLGGAVLDSANSVAVDSSGNAYVTGVSASINFPTLNAYQKTLGGGVSGTNDFMVAKFGPTGTKLYSTYLGGSGADVGNYIVVNSGGVATITGQSASTNFPTKRATYKTNAGSDDIILLSMKSDGTLDYSTYYGGSGSDIGRGVAIGTNSAYLTGESSSSNLPLLSAFDFNQVLKEGFVAKFTNNAAEVSMSPSSNNFGTRTPNSGPGSPVTFTMTNVGNQNLVVSSISVLDTTNYVLDKGNGSGGTCGATPTLTPTSSCTLTIAFNPQSAGTFNSSLRIASNDDTSPDDFSITGVGQALGPTLTITPAGTGNGTVTSSSGGISCVRTSGVNSGTCSASYVASTVVTLTAAAATGSTFTSWSGNADCSDGIVTMDVDKGCTATFTINTYTLTVSLGGTGSGTVTSNPAGISLPGDGTQDYDYGTVVTLTATANTGQTFAGWTVSSGTCTGTTSPCTVTMDGAKNLTATFNVNQYALNTTLAGTGSGTVTGGGINCSRSGGVNSGTCSVNINYGAAVTLTAAAPTGSTFAGWTVSAGTCTGTTSPCIVTMDSTSGKNLTATFNVEIIQLSLTGGGLGNGTVTSTNDGGGTNLNCTITAGVTSGTCSSTFNYNTSVTLTAAPATGSTFAGWSGTGGCTGTGTCMLTMTGAKAATATFDVEMLQLSLTGAGNGTGTITSNTGGINCTRSGGNTTGTCSASYAYNTTVTLT